jgi:hypothetical protein
MSARGPQRRLSCAHNVCAQPHAVGAAAPGSGALHRSSPAHWVNLEGCGVVDRWGRAGTLQGSMVRGKAKADAQAKNAAKQAARDGGGSTLGVCQTRRARLCTFCDLCHRDGML